MDTTTSTGAREALLDEIKRRQAETDAKDAAAFAELKAKAAGADKVKEK